MRALSPRSRVSCVLVASVPVSPSLAEELSQGNAPFWFEKKGTMSMWMVLLLGLMGYFGAPFWLVVTIPIPASLCS